MENTSFLCTICGSSFRERWELQSHNQKSHDTRVFKCATSEKEFSFSQTLKIHLIFYHYSDHFAMTGGNLRETNGEHHEALHHPLKTIERDRNLYMKKKPRWNCPSAEKPSVHFHKKCFRCWFYSQGQTKN